ncbi:hypothetical protein OGAPHI_006392 [Ogataea philodendri]|uniref:DNA-directed RNA polymerase n=1 Tax=Ogataea philodendri TaxID=1378263 RepID=A0A9P8NYT2_9ASCO|nr:uncharacterized protein OGAPHI_006392 [Ogataea philodendri]KAH3661544.1 hypothetical protein OGAPHI_006392 [Ogataea philodendri]
MMNFFSTRRHAKQLALSAARAKRFVGATKSRKATLFSGQTYDKSAHQTAAILGSNKFNHIKYSDLEEILLSSSVDNILTPSSSNIIRSWSLFEACLFSKDFERADMILQSIASVKSAQDKSKPTKYFYDGVCEFLSTWGRKDGVSITEIKDWLKTFSAVNPSFRSQPRIVAWIIRLKLEKNSPITDILSDIDTYSVARPQQKKADIFRYVDIIGADNIRTLVNADPSLVNELPKEYKEFFKLFVGQNDQQTSLEGMEVPESLDGVREKPLEVSQVPDSTIEKSASGQSESVVNEMDELMPVSSFNLKAIRHTLLGLVNNYNGEGKFLDKFFSLAKQEKLDIDYDYYENSELKPDFFEMKSSLPADQHEKFDMVLDMVSEDRQKFLESTSIESARLKWEHEFEKIKDKSMPSSVGSYLHDWLKSIEPLVAKEIDEYWVARKLETKGKLKNASAFDHERYTQKLKYGPYLSLIDPSKSSITTILEVLKTCISSDLARGAPVSKVVMSIGRALELEFKAERLLAADIDVHKNFRAIRKTTEFKKYLRGTRASKLIEEAELKAESAAGECVSATSWDSDSRCRVGSVMLSLLLQVAKVDVEGTDPVSGEKKTALAPAFYHTYDYQNGSKIGVIKLNTNFASKLGTERVDNTLQPHFMPMIAKPRPWTTHDDGGYFLKRSPVLKAKNSPEQAAYAKTAASHGKIDNVLQALNNLGFTAWTVNKDVLKVMIEAWNTGEEFLEIPKFQETLELPPPPSGDCTLEAFFKHKKLCQQLCREYSKNRSMRCDTNYKLEIARAYVGERIFFPHSLDFRGRAYPMPPYFNHLGNDLSRGLLKFWKGKELGEEGLRWLKIHVCNLLGFDKLPLDERVKYVDDNMEKIFDSARDPWNGSRLWVEADKPWQFLASAIELERAYQLEDPTKFVSHQPVHQDGTCNGLQHYAALGGDMEGAKQVNLVPGDKPSDVYTHVAHLVQRSVDEDVRDGVSDAEIVKDVISRKLVKQTVMTSVYGVTYVGARAQITKRLKEIEMNDLQILPASKYLTQKVFKAIRELFDNAHAIQDWLIIAAKRVSKSIRTDVEIMDDTDYMCSVIWTTPLGLPVVQPYREYKGKPVETALQTITIVDPYQPKRVDGRKQASGFPPNFIHSLDATHMILSANKCSEAGLTFSSVHDSYWTHASDVSVMNKVLRDQFVHLHTNNLVEKLDAELRMRYGDTLMVYEIDQGTEMGLAYKHFRYLLSKTLKRSPTLIDEAMTERQRQILLKSKDPEEVKQGKEMVTPVTIAEELQFKPSPRDEVNKGTTILVPFDLPPVPPRGDFDVGMVRDSLYFFS